MKLYELVNKYHIGTELSCAESMIKACNEYYHLDLSADALKMFSVMGTGMETGYSCCGAFTAAVGVIGWFTAQDNKTDVANEQGTKMIYELTKFMFDNFRTLQCGSLREIKVKNYDNPCLFVVEEIAKKLEELLIPLTGSNSVNPDHLVS